MEQVNNRTSDNSSVGEKCGNITERVTREAGECCVQKVKQVSDLDKGATFPAIDYRALPTTVPFSLPTPPSHTPPVAGMDFHLQQIPVSSGAVSSPDFFLEVEIKKYLYTWTGVQSRLVAIIKR